MTKLPPSVLWAIRDDRNLSGHAKSAYMMLWTRQPDIRPSMQTLAGDMGTSLSTAHRAVRELQGAGLLKVIPRLTEKGDPDTNAFELYPPVRQTPPPCPPDTTPHVTGTPKDSNVKTTSEGRKSQASRRARPAVTRAEQIHFMRRSVMLSYSATEAEDLTDGQAVALDYLLVGDRNPHDRIAYVCKIFSETPYLDTHLANAGTEEDWE